MATSLAPETSAMLWAKLSSLILIVRETVRLRRAGDNACWFLFAVVAWICMLFLALRLMNWACRRKVELITVQ